MQTAIVAIILFGGLVSVHEFGHFVVAKWAGMYVQEFSIGMGPLIFSKQTKETLYSLRLLPLGGFVRIIGEDTGEEERSDIPKIEIPEHRRYQNISVWKRMLMSFAGPLMNIVAAVLIFCMMFMVVGEAVPIEHPDSTVIALVEGGPAELAGMQPGDRIVEIDGNPIAYWEELNPVFSAAPDESPMEIVVYREKDGIGSNIHLQITPRYQPEEQRKMIGIYGATAEQKRVGPIRAMQLGVQATGNMVKTMVDVLGQLFTGKIDITDEEEGLTGPVGIINIIGQTAKAGWLNVCYLAALLSINLGIMNLIPIPSLDGSKILFLLLEALRGKPLPPEKEGLANFIGFSLLMALILFVTYQDILRLFR